MTQRLSATGSTFKMQLSMFAPPESAATAGGDAPAPPPKKDKPVDKPKPK